MAAKHCEVTAGKIATEMSGGRRILRKWKICISRVGHTPFLCLSSGSSSLCPFSHYPECRDFRASWIVIKISSKTAAV